QPARIDYNLTFSIQFNKGAVHGTRRRPLEIPALHVVPASMARALELVLAFDPVWCTAQMGAAAINDEQPVRPANHPDTMGLLETFIHAGAEIGRIADAEFGARLEQRARKKEAQEHQKIPHRDRKSTRL